MIWEPRRKLLIPKRSFMPGTFPGGVAGGGEPAITVAEVSFIDVDADASNLTTYEFTNVSIGDAHSSREIFLGVKTNSSQEGSPRTVSSGTIGGVSLRTTHVQLADAPWQSVSLVSAPVPSGITATISITMSGGCNDMDISVFRVVGMNSATPHDTLTDTTDNPATGTIDIPADGFVIAVATARFGSAGDGCSWTGVTESYDTDSASTNNRISGGFVHQLGVQTGRTITVDNSPNDMLMCAASFA